MSWLERVVAIVCVSHDEATNRYVARRPAEGKTKREIIRGLKRYLARNIYRIVVPLVAERTPRQDIGASQIRVHPSEVGLTFWSRYQPI